MRIIELPYNLKRLAQIVFNTKLRLPRKKIKVLFVVHFRPYWTTLEPIYKEMLTDKNFEPLVVIVDDQANDPDPIYNEIGTKLKFANALDLSKFLTLRDIKHTYWNDLVRQSQLTGFKVLEKIRPDYVFRQIHWEGSMPEEFRTKALEAYRICYLPYEFEVAEVSRFTVEQEIFTDAWKIFVASKIHFDYYQSKNKNLNLEVSYSPKLEQIAKRSRIVNSTDRKTILWAPHHSVGDEWLRFGTFHLNYLDILDFALRHPEVNFIFRAHHLLFQILKEKCNFEENDIENFLMQWNSLDNTEIDTNVDYSESFSKADLLLTDGISFLVEFLATCKPLIYMERQGHEKLTSVGDYFLGYSHISADISETIDLLETFLAGELKPKTQDSKESSFDLMSPKLNSPRKILDSLLHGQKVAKS